MGDFYTMVASLKDREEVKIFFKDLLSLSEIVMISRRIQIAQMLLEGKSYEEIRRELKAGFSISARLRNGSIAASEDIRR